MMFVKVSYIGDISAEPTHGHMTHGAKRVDRLQFWNENTLGGVDGLQEQGHPGVSMVKLSMQGYPQPQSFA